MSSRWQSTHCGENDSIGFDGENKLCFCLDKSQYSKSDGVEAVTRVCESQYNPGKGADSE
jgi:hypothetical protein